MQRNCRAAVRRLEMDANVSALTCRGPRKELAPSLVGNHVVPWQKAAAVVRGSPGDPGQHWLPARPSPSPLGNAGCLHRSSRRPADPVVSHLRTRGTVWRLQLCCISGLRDVFPARSVQCPCRTALRPATPWRAPANRETPALLSTAPRL